MKAIVKTDNYGKRELTKTNRKVTVAKGAFGRETYTRVAWTDEHGYYWVKNNGHFIMLDKHSKRPGFFGFNGVQGWEI